MRIKLYNKTGFIIVQIFVIVFVKVCDMIAFYFLFRYTLCILITQFLFDDLWITNLSYSVLLTIKVYKLA